MSEHFCERRVNPSFEKGVVLTSDPDLACGMPARFNRMFGWCKSEPD